MSVKVSIVASSIRPHLWNRIAASLLSNKIEYEVVMAGPKPGLVPDRFKYIMTDVKPAQCYEIGFRNATGELVMWSADDAVYSPGALDTAYHYWKSFNNEKLVVSFRSIEDGCDMTEGHRFFHSDKNSPGMAPFGLMSRKLFHRLGGYDRKFICGQAENDMVMRVYEIGGKVSICPWAYVKVEHREAHSHGSPFRTIYSFDRSILESLWTNDGEISSERLKPVESFSDEKLLFETQGPKGQWDGIHLFKSHNPHPEVSIILLDWSCRESCHSLDYLSRQSVSGKQYEVLWIEYYNRIHPQIDKRLKECPVNMKQRVPDQWIVMGMPDKIYYHKHLMYNTGIIASRGSIICFADSDAIFSPSFVESIIKTFSSNRDIVLHIDEIRNTDSRFYPFNYPSIEDIPGKGRIQWCDGHHRNYGACMCALKEDLIEIGGADEHKDFLGHICGPYDMTFRLINAGKCEIWHENEFLYHVWHPGTEGERNYSGPAVGAMSATAYNTLETGRVLPLVENPAINILRTGLLKHAVRQEKLSEWALEEGR